MIIHEVKQGSPEWHALRANTRNASEAPAMMGVSPYKSRSALVREKATGKHRGRHVDRNALGLRI